MACPGPLIWEQSGAHLPHRTYSAADRGGGLGALSLRPVACPGPSGAFFVPPSSQAPPMTAHPIAPADQAAEIMTGAQMVVRALVDQGVTDLFGYPGGAVLPIYDALFHEPRLRHILVRHEQGATHAAAGYARSTGKSAAVLVTSGPGATNAVTGIVDALMDSIPLVVITGQVPTHLIGTDAFQECDTVGITPSCTKHNYLVKDVADLPRIMHEAFRTAPQGRPGPERI